MTLTRAEEQTATVAVHQNEGDQVSTLVKMAIEQKVPVELLERLVALQERVTARNARQAFIEAKARFQELCGDIVKSKTAKITTTRGSQYEYSFAPLEAIQSHIRPHLTACGLSYAWDIVSFDKGVLLIACDLTHVDGHSERSTFPVPIDTAAAMSAAQKTGAAQTYGKRQSLVAVLGITTADADSDGAEAEAEDNELISESEAADLSSLAEEVGVNTSKFLAMFGVQSFGEIKKSDVATARRSLELKRK